MTDPDAAAPGLLTAIRHLSASLLETARVRLALLGVDLEFEKLRLARSLMSAAVALLFIAAALVMFSLFVVLMLGDAYRVWALGALALVYLGVGLWLWHRANAELKHSGGPFASSLAELERDAQALRDTR